MEVSLSEIGRFLAGPAEASSFDDRLLAANVRYFLGRDNTVNKEIATTIICNPQEFWYRNNGITIVCDQIIGIPNGSHAITLVNPNIVNGGQTANVIHETIANNLTGSPAGSVPIKLIETKDRALIDRIAISSNTQTRIFGRDLRANDEIQEKLQLALAASGYFYRRKSGETSADKSLRQVDALRAGQILLSYCGAEPTKSKTNSNEIFDDLYGVAFGPSP